MYLKKITAFLKFQKQEYLYESQRESVTTKTKGLKSKVFETLFR